MKIKRIQITNFTAFENIEFDCSPGINVLIGTNSTGKTHLMKAVYAILKVFPQNDLNHEDSMKKLIDRLDEKFSGVFKPADDKIGRLIRRGRTTGGIVLDFDSTHLEVMMNTSNVLIPKSSQERGWPEPESVVYLPPHEFLSIYEANTKRETFLDETYYDLCLSLNALPLHGERKDDIQELLDPLERAIGNSSRVIQEHGRFYFEMPEGKLEAHLVSEGFRKLAGLVYLINNGSLTKNGVFFWDEPEAHLNPLLIPVVVNVLRILAKSGVQIFVATHDYLLSQELSLLAEYSTDTPIKFLSMVQKSEGGPVTIEEGDTLVDIENNPILDEFAAHYDREMELIHQLQTE